MTNLNELERRIADLEHANAFSERQNEQLNEALTEIGQRVMSLIARVKKIETRLEGVADRVGEFADRGVEAPPHAAGPDVSRDPL
ncbi:MAG: putative coiled-coil protein SlyX [Phycisphaerales bacterium]|jgi:uncharacterized coiled-coil protein SlyX